MYQRGKAMRHYVLLLVLFACVPAAVWWMFARNPVPVQVPQQQALKIAAWGLAQSVIDDTNVPLPGTVRVRIETITVSHVEGDYYQATGQTWYGDPADWWAENLCTSWAMRFNLSTAGIESFDVTDPNQKLGCL